MNINKYLIIALIASVGLNIYLWNRDSETITIPPQMGSVTIETPEPIVIYKTIERAGKTEYVATENPINQELLSKYNNSLDSIEKLKLYSLAITERKYIEIFNDSVQKITVESDVIGTLTKQKISYITKSKEITILKPSNRLEFYLGGNIAVPIVNPAGSLLDPLAVGLELEMLTNKNIFKIGINTNKQLTGGISFKF